MTEETDSKTVRAGSSTYFFDLKQTKEEKPYMVITESRFQGEGKGHRRSRIIVFPEHAMEFLTATEGMIKRLVQER